MDRPERPRALTVVWGLLLVLGAFFLFAVASDLAADARIGLPSDHVETFTGVAGVTWDTAKHTSHGMTQYITLLEVAYAFHELVFALLIVAIPFRHGRRWAWWACWVVEIANLAYLLTFGRHDSTIFARALVAAIARCPGPVLYLSTGVDGTQMREHAPPRVPCCGVAHARTRSNREEEDVGRPPEQKLSSRSTRRAARIRRREGIAGGQAPGLQQHGPP